MMVQVPSHKMYKIIFIQQCDLVQHLQSIVNETGVTPNQTLQFKIALDVLFREVF